MDFPSLIRTIAVSAVPVLIAITFHEVAHGYVAHRLGDGTAKAMGRLTLNPLAHIDPVGTVLIPAMLLIFSGGQFVFGYARPVPINPYNFRNPRRDMAISAAAGPAMNLLLAAACVLIMKLVVHPAAEVLPSSAVETFIKPLNMMLYSGIILNVVLASFNLIPMPPLDGGRIAVGFLPIKQSMALSRLEPYGMLIVIVLIATGLARYIVSPLTGFFLWLLGLL